MMAERERRLGRYRLLDLVERDGDALLHRAVDPANGRAVALWTVPLARFHGSPEGSDTLERFRREAAAAAHLSHPAIPAVLASGEHAGTAFVATESVEGPSLAARLEGRPPPSLEESVATLDRVLDALTAAHRAGLVHGALSAAVIHRSGGEAVVTGFGRTALTAPQATRLDDVSAGGRLAERLLTGQADRPAVAALLERLRDGGGTAFPDADALRRAIVALEARTPPSNVRTTSGRTPRWPLWLGGIAVAAVVAVVAVLPRPPLVPGRAAPVPPPPPVLEAAAATPPEVEPLLPPPPRPSHRPPVAVVAEALRSLPCALVTVEDSNGRLLVTGTVAGVRSGEAVRNAVEANPAGWTYGLDLAIADAGFCAPLSIVAPALDANRGVAAPLALTVESTGEDGLALDAGDALVLEVAAPSDHAVELRVDYFTVDGT
ncbi:serine/threonine protein kinase, partial [Azospirillum sp. TSO35-2]